MQPDNPISTPSQDAPASDAASPEPVSDEPKQGSSPGWWQRLFNRRPATEADADGGESGEPESASEPLRLTREELDRRIQSETDRREAKRAAEARAAERKRLRDEDPWAYAEQDRQAEKAQETDQGLAGFFATVGLEHDKHSIDPLMEQLPVAERERIMKLEGAGKGLAGRKLVVQEALKSLEKHWKVEGEREAQDRLRRNPAFRKQVLAEGRGSLLEPELLPAVGSSAADRKVSDILRNYYGLQNGHNSAG